MTARVFGCAMRYGRFLRPLVGPTDPHDAGRVGEYFEIGAFSRSLARPVRLTLNHDRGRSVRGAVRFFEVGAGQQLASGLWFEAALDLRDAAARFVVDLARDNPRSARMTGRDAIAVSLTFSAWPSVGARGENWYRAGSATIEELAFVVPPDRAALPNDTFIAGVRS